MNLKKLLLHLKAHQKRYSIMRRKKSKISRIIKTVTGMRIIKWRISEGKWRIITKMNQRSQKWSSQKRSIFTNKVRTIRKITLEKNKICKQILFLERKRRSRIILYRTMFLFDQWLKRLKLWHEELQSKIKVFQKVRLIRNL